MRLAECPSTESCWKLLEGCRLWKRQGVTSSGPRDDPRRSAGVRSTTRSSAKSAFLYTAEDPKALMCMIRAAAMKWLPWSVIESLTVATVSASPASACMKCGRQFIWLDVKKPEARSPNLSRVRPTPRLQFSFPRMNVHIRSWVTMHCVAVAYPQRSKLATDSALLCDR